MRGAEPFDLMILGGGAAAFSAAIRATELGARVLMGNDGLPLGGTCVNVGCVPSKFLLAAVEEFWRLRVEKPPWLAGAATLDFERLMQEKDELVTSLRQRNYWDVLQALGAVTLVQERARLVSAQEIEAGGKRYRGQRMVIATGARPRLPSIPGLEAAQPWTNRSALAQRSVPRSLVVLGAGPLGLEFAQIFHRVGARVRVLEVAPQILPGHDPELAEELACSLQEEGIEIRTGCTVQRVEGHPGALRLFDERGVCTETERILAATGIQPNTDRLGLAEVGVETDARGFIVTDRTQATSVPGIYAAGDVTGVMPLETVAAKQGFLAAEHALTGSGPTLNPELVPQVVFTDPQFASVGISEARLMEETGRCSCRTLPLSAVPKAHVTGDTRGRVKLVVEPSTGRIRGAQAVGRQAGEMIHVPLLAMKAGWTVRELIDTVHAFPTYAEAWKICAQTFFRASATMSCCVV